MRISDWSSDVCSSDLIAPRPHRLGEDRVGGRPALARGGGDGVEDFDGGLDAGGGGHALKPLPLAGGVWGGPATSRSPTPLRLASKLASLAAPPACGRGRGVDDRAATSTRRIVRRLARDCDVVDVAFAQTRVGDAHEFGALAELLERS